MMQGPFRKHIILVGGLVLLGVVLTACAAQPSAPSEVVKTVEVTKVVAQEPEQEVRTPLPQSTSPLPTPVPSEPPTGPEVLVEQRLVELEWPPRLRLGDSDVIRLSLVPSEDGYILQADYPEHRTDVQDLKVSRPGGYDLTAVARLDGVGFNISPQGERELLVPVGEQVTWLWSLTPEEPGKQRLSIALLLRWRPADGAPSLARESLAYTRSLDVQVSSFFGLTRGQAMTGGFLGLLFGGGLSLVSFIPLLRSEQTKWRTGKPKSDLVIEPHPGLVLQSEEEVLLKILFSKYARVVLESEFLSGYSGARAFLALPVRLDDRSDAYTIVKIGPRNSILQEHANYEIFVKDTLPPVTARIQQPPVSVPRGLKAALQYTFIAEPGRMPTSLRQALLHKPDPGLLHKLFEIFGPNWWMQRSPYTFRLGQEYDRLLPSHYVIEPAQSRGVNLDGQTSPGEVDLQVGDIVTLGKFTQVESRLDGRSLSLRGEAKGGQPALRVRWMSRSESTGKNGKVVATRQSLLYQSIQGMELFGFPEPIARLDEVQNQTVSGTRSVIHGDLNLENVLVGPGDFVWLIDFAMTREGHPLFDFARLQTEIIAHVIAPQVHSPEDYTELLRKGSDSQYAGLWALLEAVVQVGSRCLFNPSDVREFYLTAYLACLGALKFANLEPFQKHLLYVTAAYYSEQI